MERFNIYRRTRTLATVAVCLVIVGAGCLKRMPRPAAVEPPPAPSVGPAQFGPAPAKITYVNTAHHFVVIDFSSRAMPTVGATLPITRVGQRVGAVKITEERRARFATADIVEGELRIGDEAH